ncbi:serine aminopeptidase domain-containing protein [Paraburkholderia flava]|uniref:alpha/beta hydrolase family protein n=1 Tax=Paraburkholderia flava TaxID=2547393 RepID=UPI001061D77E|nr:alpha/beta hydrolase [Paraburkholderia flava]
MKSVVFDDCFGWLHPVDECSGWLHPVDGDHGIVLCNPFGYDALCTHRGWRRLAERLAATGMPVLRFDYLGTGDSAGFEDDPQRVDAWLDSIAAAVRRLREWTGVRRVSLVGLRLGATLAALAAERIGDIDGLVLLAPAIVGRNYLRELRAHRQSWLSTPAGMNADPISEQDGYVEAFGFGLYGDDIARLAAIDLRTDTSAPAARVLLLEANDRSRNGALATHYAAHGVAVDRQTFDEYDRFMIEALYSEEPVDAFARLTEWLASGGAAVAAERAPSLEQTDEPTDEPMLELPAQGALEHPVAFGPYFGIYCEPATPRADAPAVLFFNTGASHHIGDGRIFVLFARRLAALGITSLRMDLGGLGDATPTMDQVTLDTIYSEQACRDAAAGADWLVARGHASVATVGVCGGAFVGLHASALQPRIVGAYCVNLQKFIWDGATREPGEHQFASSKVYWHAAWKPRKWLRALRGDSHPLRIAAVLARRAATSAWLGVTGWLEQRTGRPLVANEVRTLVRTIHAKGVQLRLVYGAYDVGLDEARVQFGPQLGALRRYPRIRAATLPKLDHALFTRPAREVAMADAERWLFDEVMSNQSGVSARGLRDALAASALAGVSAASDASAAAVQWFDRVSP